MTSTTATKSTPATLPVPTAQGVLLKTDVRGRVRTSAERRQAIVDEFDHSGLSAAQFAKLVGVKYSTFAQWVQKRRSDSGPSKSCRQAPRAKSRAPLRLLEAMVDPAAQSALGSCPGLQLHLSGGVRLELTCAAQVPLVVALAQGLQRPVGSC